MKKILYCLIILILPLIFITETNAKTIFNTNDYVLLEDDQSQDKIIYMDTTCQDFSNIVRMAGYIIFLVKIAIPLIIIVKASINLTKVVTSGKPEELKKQATKLATSCVAGIVIFFIPTIVYLAMNITDAYGRNITADANICKQCLLNPSECNNAKETAKNSIINGIQQGANNITNTR